MVCSRYYNKNARMVDVISVQQHRDRDRDTAKEKPTKRELDIEQWRQRRQHRAPVKLSDVLIFKVAIRFKKIAFFTGANRLAVSHFNLFFSFSPENRHGNFCQRSEITNNHFSCFWFAIIYYLYLWLNKIHVILKHAGCKIIYKISYK